jgi:hypothetical protein
MSPRLPPPDPFEPSGTPPDDLGLPAPATIFLKGQPSREQDRVADAILTARPGVLFVCVHD